MIAPEPKLCYITIVSNTNPAVIPPNTERILLMRNDYRLPPELEPLSPWAYFGLSLLYSIPVIGWIFLIVFAISGSNINRRNHARSFFCVYVVAIILFVILLILRVPIMPNMNQ